MNAEQAIKIILNYGVYGCGYCHEGGDEIPEAFTTAAKALEKQVPKKPFIIKFDNGAEIINCGKCYMGSPIVRGVGYCPHCGTKIDWEEGENE